MIDGTPYDHRPGGFAQHQSMAFILQDLGMIEWMTVAENITPALGYARKGAFINWRKVGCNFDPLTRVQDLSRTEKSLVVIARGLATKRKLWICKAPTADVDVGAKAEIYALLNRALESGVGIIIVSTDFEEVAAVCHRAIEFSQGKIAGPLSGAELTAENLIQAASAGNVTTH